MADNPTNFWQELKRRKVFRVIVMYAAAAYVIIELFPMEILISLDFISILKVKSLQ